MFSIREKEFWLSFIDKYRTFPCLWDVQCKDYNRRPQKDSALMQLVNMCKAVNPDADRDFVRKRIANMRTAFSREFKKMEEAKRTGDGYEATLWYYNNLLFLKDSDEMIKNDMDMEEVREDESIPDSFSPPPFLIEKTEPIKVAPKPSSHPRTNPLKKRSLVQMQRRFLEQCSGLVATQNQDEDEYDILGRRIAEHFRNMEPQQRLFAEKIVSDVLINGRMNLLSANSQFVVAANPTTVPNTYFLVNGPILDSSGDQLSQGAGNLESTPTYVKIE